MTNRNYSELDIAIIGVSCRFPGADNWRQFWNNLKNGVESIRHYSVAEAKELGVDELLIENTNFVRARSSINNKDAFDAHFFDYRPAEAALMNPVHRIFHECVWEAIEDGAVDLSAFQGPIGLFAGADEDLN